jgi:hypothetical protein
MKHSPIDRTERRFPLNRLLLPVRDLMPFANLPAREKDAFFSLLDE